MKKIVSIVLALSVLLCGISAFADDSQIKFVKKLTAADASVAYRSLTTKEAGEVAVSVDVPEEFFSGSHSAKLFVATYSSEASKELKSVKVKEITSADAGKTVVSDAINIAHSDIVRAFLWDGASIAPVASDVTLPEKQQCIIYDFESDAIGKMSSTTDVYQYPSGASVVADPSADGTHGQVMKLHGSDGISADSKITARNFLLKFQKYANDNKLTTTNPYASVDYEFDMYIPSQWAYTKEVDDGEGNITLSPVIDNVIYDISIGDTPYAKYRFTVSRDGKRIVWDDRLDRSGYSCNIENRADIEDRWMHVKIETRPYVDEYGVVDERYCETYLWFDGELIFHKMDSASSDFTNNLTGTCNKKGIGRRIYIQSSSDTSTYAKPIYFDNIKVSM